MAKPTSLKVGGICYEVIFSSQEVDHAAVQSKIDYGAVTQHNIPRILVREDLGLQVQKSALLHEILHCSWPESWPTSGVYFDDEEKLISLLEGPLFGVMCDNPDVFRWLMQ